MGSVVHHVPRSGFKVDLEDGNWKWGFVVNLEYAWSMPNHMTFKMKPIDSFIRSGLEPGLILDPFANRPSDYGAITNDLNPNADVDFHMDALAFLRQYADDSVDSVLFDPPYSLRQVKECYDSIGHSLTQRESQRFFSDLRDEIARVVRPGGVVFSFGWSSVGIGKTRGFVKESLLVVSHGGIHNDTLCLIERKSSDTAIKDGRVE